MSPMGPDQTTVFYKFCNSKWIGREIIAWFVIVPRILGEHFMIRGN